MKEFQVKRNNLNEHRLVEAIVPDLGENLGTGELLLKVEKFGFSANNITYGVIGEQLGYWQFFPPHGGAIKEWGILPVWGFAEVIESATKGVEVGERLFGYFPPAAYLKMENINFSAHRIIDGSAHRSALPPGYNTYRRLNSEVGYNREMDNERMLLWPLHLTSFCIWDQMQDNDWYGAQQVVVVSASSKTSIGLGYALQADVNAPSSVGLTSNDNQIMVSELGIYNTVATYDNLAKLDASKQTVIVDMSGNSAVLQALSRQLSDNMAYCINVGLTHWEDASTEPLFSPDKCEFFFAPSHIQKRMKDWGPIGFEQKTGLFLMTTAMKSRDWLKVEKHAGVEGLVEVYSDVLEGKVAPEKGIVIEL